MRTVDLEFGLWVERLTADLPPVDKQRLKLIAQYKAELLDHSIPGGTNIPVPIAGQDIFEKHCLVCRQLAGKGSQVGPNLDGIATRGIDRLMEDILDPNRNVDVNFRATSVLTTNGKVYNGLLRPATGSQTVVVDSTGKEITIPANEIEETFTSSQSPMPSNFHEILTSEEVRLLLGYLLSAR